MQSCCFKSPPGTNISCCSLAWYSKTFGFFQILIGMYWYITASICSYLAVHVAKHLFRGFFLTCMSSLMKRHIQTSTHFLTACWSHWLLRILCVLNKTVLYQICFYDLPCMCLSFSFFWNHDRFCPLAYINFQTACNNQIIICINNYGTHKFFCCV